MQFYDDSENRVITEPVEITQVHVDTYDQDNASA